MNSKDLNNKNDLEKDISDWPNSSIRLMYHMNMTCAQPSDLAGKRLPHSWDYFCPLPSITGIEINMLTPNSDLAQLICIGKGRPTPSLAWTYKIHGQKVQQILDPSIKQNFNDQYFLSSKDKSFFNILSNNELIERKLALNISLNSIDIKNFTCTIWNNDKISSSSVLSTSINSLNNITDKLKTTSLIVPTNDNHQIKLQYYRLHEVTVRISGPIRSPEFINTPILNKLSNIDNNKKLSEIDNKKISSIINVQTPMKSIQQDNQDIYSYLFIKRLHY
ncbi:unnamed protein product [Heterobilharzia americana]|nr:unnamed protein product [Heterobilharzia americana]